MNFYDECLPKKKKLHKVFPWIKNILEENSKSFPDIQKSSALQLLHESVEKEFQAIFSNEKDKRAENLYALLSSIFMSFCWKMKWKKDEKYLQGLVTKLLCYLVYLSIFLCKNSKNDKINRLLFLFQLVPDIAILYDALLLINNLFKNEKKIFALILRYVLCKENKPLVCSPEMYIKVLLLFRKLKQIIRESKKEAVVFIASTIAQPPGTLSWLSSLNLEDVNVGKETNITHILFGEKSCKNTVKNLLMAVLNEEYFPWIENFQKIKRNNQVSLSSNTMKKNWKKTSKKDHSSKNKGNKYAAEINAGDTLHAADSIKLSDKIVLNSCQKRKKGKSNKKNLKTKSPKKSKKVDEARKNKEKKLSSIPLNEVQSELQDPQIKTELNNSGNCANNKTLLGNPKKRKRVKSDKKFEKQCKRLKKSEKQNEPKINSGNTCSSVNKINANITDLDRRIEAELNDLRYSENNESVSSNLTKRERTVKPKNVQKQHQRLKKSEKQNERSENTDDNQSNPPVNEINTNSTDLDHKMQVELNDSAYCENNKSASDNLPKRKKAVKPKNVQKQCQGLKKSEKQNETSENTDNNQSNVPVNESNANLTDLDLIMEAELNDADCSGNNKSVSGNLTKRKKTVKSKKVQKLKKSKKQKEINENTDNNQSNVPVNEINANLTDLDPIVEADMNETDCSGNNKSVSGNLTKRKRTVKSKNVKKQSQRLKKSKKQNEISENTDNNQSNAPVKEINASSTDLDHRKEIELNDSAFCENNKSASSNIPKRKKAVKPKKAQRLKKSEKQNETSEDGDNKLVNISTKSIKTKFTISSPSKKAELDIFDDCMVCEKKVKEKQIENQKSKKSDTDAYESETSLKTSCKFDEVSVIDSPPIFIENDGMFMPRNDMNESELPSSKDPWEINQCASDSSKSSGVEDVNSLETNQDFDESQLSKDSCEFTQSTLNNTSQSACDFTNKSQLLFSKDSCLLNESAHDGNSQSTNDSINSRTIVNETELLFSQDPCYLKKTITIGNEGKECVSDSPIKATSLTPKLLEDSEKDTCTTDIGMVIEESVKGSEEKSCQTDDLITDYFNTFGNHILDEDSRSACSTNDGNSTLLKENEPREFQTTENILSQVKLSENYLVNKGSLEIKDTNSKHFSCHEDSSDDSSIILLNGTGGIYSNNSSMLLETRENLMSCANDQFSSLRKDSDEIIVSSQQKNIPTSICNNNFIRNSQSSDTDITEILQNVNSDNGNQCNNEFFSDRRVLNTNTQVTKTTAENCFRKMLFSTNDSQSVNGLNSVGEGNSPFSQELFTGDTLFEGTCIQNSINTAHGDATVLPSPVKNSQKKHPLKNRNLSSKKKISKSKNKIKNKASSNMSDFSIFKFPKNPIMSTSDITSGRSRLDSDGQTNRSFHQNSDYQKQNKVYCTNKYSSSAGHEAGRTENLQNERLFISSSIPKMVFDDCGTPNQLITVYNIVCSSDKCKNVLVSSNLEVQDDVEISFNKDNNSLHSLKENNASVDYSITEGNVFLMNNNIHKSNVSGTMPTTFQPESDASTSQNYFCNLSRLNSTPNKNNQQFVASEANTSSQDANMKTKRKLTPQKVGLDNIPTKCFEPSQNSFHNSIPNHDRVVHLNDSHHYAKVGFDTRPTRYSELPPNSFHNNSPHHDKVVHLNDPHLNAKSGGMPTRYSELPQNSFHNNSSHHDKVVHLNDPNLNAKTLTISPEFNIKIVSAYSTKDLVVYPASKIQVNLGDQIEESNISLLQRNGTVLLNNLENQTVVESSVPPGQSENSFLDGISISTDGRKQYPNQLEMNNGLDDMPVLEKEVNPEIVSSTPKIHEDTLSNAGTSGTTKEHNCKWNFSSISHIKDNGPRISTDGFSSDDSDCPNLDYYNYNGTFETDHSRILKKHTQQTVSPSKGNNRKESFVKPSKFQIYSSQTESETSSDDFVCVRKTGASQNKAEESKCKKKVSIKRKKKSLYNQEKSYYLRSRDRLSVPKKYDSFFIEES